MPDGGGNDHGLGVGKGMLPPACGDVEGADGHAVPFYQVEHVEPSRRVLRGSGVRVEAKAVDVEEHFG